MKLGSLFDGSGTCPLAASMLGITPAWASEIEKYPVAVTSARFPDMKHLGDITKIDGAAIEPVDIITFGSPCQDLSVAGKQKGLIEGERSNLFFEAMRIIKEMRSATNGKYPRYIVWENVPGAFSSNQGRDFLAVLHEVTEACGGHPGDVPEPPKGKWGHAGYVDGGEWSIAWRVFDSQYWGVPQRRKRIYLVADFAGECAGQILFESEGLLGDFEQSRKAWEEASGHAVGSPGGGCGEGIGYTATSFGRYVEGTGTLKQSGGDLGALRPSTWLNTVSNDSVVYPVDNHAHDSRVSICEDGIVPALTSRMGTGDNNVPLVLNDQGGSSMSVDSIASTLRAESHQHEPVVEFEPGIAKREGGDSRFVENVTPTLRANAGDNQTAVAYAFDGYNSAVSDTEAAIGVNCGMSTGRNGVVQSVGFCPEVSAKTRGIGFERESADIEVGCGSGNCGRVLMDAHQHQTYRASGTCGRLTAGQNGHAGAIHP